MTKGGSMSNETIQGSLHIPANGLQRTNILGYETVFVDGVLEGNVERVGWFCLGPDGRFTGTGDALQADLSGSVRGDIHCQRKLIVRHTARIEGNLSAPVIEVHP